MSNLIWQGKGEKTTRNHQINSALLAGVAVSIDYASGSFLVATSETKAPLILTNLTFAGQDVNTPYNAGDTAAAYEVSSNDEFLLRAGSAVSIGDPVGIGSNGRFVRSVSNTFAIAQSSAANGELFEAIIVNPANLETKATSAAPAE